MSKRQSQAQPVCPLCQAPLQFGVQHICPVTHQQQNGNGDNNGLKTFMLKLLIPLIMFTLTELVGGIWWASAMQSDVHVLQQQLAAQAADFKEQLANQRTIIDRIDGYFRKPPAQ